MYNITYKIYRYIIYTYCTYIYIYIYIYIYMYSMYVNIRKYISCGIHFITCYLDQFSFIWINGWFLKNIAFLDSISGKFLEGLCNQEI